MRTILLVCGFLVAFSASIAGQQSQAPIVKWPLDISIVSLMALHGADLALTERCLGTGRCREVNPFFAPFSKSPVVFGAGRMAGAAALSWMLLAQHAHHPRLTVALALTLNAAWSVVVAHNVHAYLHAQSR